ncbi:MAG: hypothetical protein GC160_24560 [Acidobacteria bacterium]|nr:hypothetical protein [Acidobacteriota bacterium]
MFSGLMSRCVMPRLWAYSRACSACTANRSVLPGGTGPSAITRSSETPSTSSITITSSSPTQKALCTEAMLGWLRLAWSLISRWNRSAGACDS